LGGGKVSEGSVDDRHTAGPGCGAFARRKSFEHNPNIAT